MQDHANWLVPLLLGVCLSLCGFALNEYITNLKQSDELTSTKNSNSELKAEINALSVQVSELKIAFAQQQEMIIALNKTVERLANKMDR